MLLDTHVLLWLPQTGRLSPAADQAIAASLRTGDVVVSAITAWEIGMLVRSERITLTMRPSAWLARATQDWGIRVVPIDTDIALASTSLPGDFHRDPADRFLVATARVLDVPIVTRDAAILAYAAAGHVRAVAC